VLRFVGLTLIGFLLAATAVAGPFEDGIAQYDQGHPDAAFKVWLPLAEQGHAAAQFNIALMYEKGTGVAQDAAEAARWYLAAAKQGDSDAQLKIAALYESGNGVTKDLDEARKWYDTLIASPRTDKGTVAAKASARQRVAKITDASQEVVAYDSGRYVLVHGQDGTCVIALQGYITQAAAMKFDDVAARSYQLACSKTWLMLESLGGGVEDGLNIARKVRANKFRTITRYECASACGIIFLGGIERVLAGSRAAIGLHQPASGMAGSHVMRCVKSRADPEARRIMFFFDDVIPATSDKVYQQMMATPCTTIDWVNGQRALDFGLVTTLEEPSADIFGPKTAKQ
jgi:hypothetical protein